MHKLSVVLLLCFAAVLALVCYRRPDPDQFDCWMYEAVVRTNLEHQDPASVYASIKAEPRMAVSSQFDSPTHMRQLAPLYTIKPAYVGAIAILHRAGMPIQQAIRGISAISLFAIAIVLWLWTDAPMFSALLLASPPVTGLARSGTPDAFSSAMVIAAILAYVKEKTWLSVVLLIVAIWIRTDTVILALLVIAAAFFQERLRAWTALVVSAVAIASVLVIDHVAGNYGWAVLFYTSFIAGRAGDITPHITAGLYLRAFATGLQPILNQASLWILLALVAWRQACRRDLLVVIALAVTAHFLLFPSGEVRYLVWSFLASGSLFILSVPRKLSGITSPTGGLLMRFLPFVRNRDLDRMFGYFLNLKPKSGVVVGSEPKKSRFSKRS